MAAVEQGAGLTAWRAALELDFIARADRTVVARRWHCGPLCIQKPFHPPDGACHVYLLHPPGGLAGGDRLELTARLGPGASVLLTTPASTKFYRSAGMPSVQQQSFRVSSGATLEWLPMETILFGGSRAEIGTRVELHERARFIGWEAVALGRPLSGDHYESGALSQRLEVFVAGEPLLLERLRCAADDELLRAPWGAAGSSVWGGLYAFPADERLVTSTRHAIGEPGPGLRVGVTLLDGLMVVRALAGTTELLRRVFERLWSTLREPMLGRPGIRPRIWMT